MLQNKKRVFLKTYGCQMNVRDSEVVAGLLKKAGFDLCDDFPGADVVIFNTCSVRQHAEDKVFSEIGRIVKSTRQQRKAGAVQTIKHRPVIGVIGCMAQNYGQDLFERCSDVDFVVGPADIAHIPVIVKKILAHRLAAGASGLFGLKIWETDSETRPENIYHTGFYGEKDHAYVVISEGCSNFCTYCVVPYVRGPVRHRNAANIIKEIKEAVAAGITKVTLLGQNVNSYHSPEPLGDTSVDFVHLLRLANDIEGLKEVGFVTSHPKDTKESLFTAMAECGTIRKYLHLPFQSGSDRILKAMNRGYTRATYLDLVSEYRRIVAGGILSTDIIVGFPGETEHDFRETFDLVKSVEFDSAYIFKYSPRPNTAALQLNDDVPQKEKERRHALILDLQKSISKKKKKRCLSE